MAPSPAPWAVLGDVLWCLGLGCLLGAARDAVRLALGEGPVRCFFRDIALFAAAAVLVCGFAAGASAGGLARWYMSAAVLLGVGGAACRAPRGGSTGGAGVQTAAACTQNARQARTNALTSGPKPPPRLPQSKKIC